MDTSSEYEPENPVDTVLNGDITFDNVRFGYDVKDRGCEEVLRGISFTITQGKTVALVGSSGGGKTTIFSVKGFKRLANTFNAPLTAADLQQSAHNDTHHVVKKTVSG